MGKLRLGLEVWSKTFTGGTEACPCRFPSGVHYFSRISTRSLLFVCGIPSGVHYRFAELHQESIIFRGFPSGVHYVSQVSIRNPLFFVDFHQESIVLADFHQERKVRNKSESWLDRVRLRETTAPQALQVGPSPGALLGLSQGY